MAEFYADLRDIRFNLFDFLDLGSLSKHEAFKDADQATMNDILDAAEVQAREVFSPANEIGDREGVKLENGKVKLPEVFKAVHKAYTETGWLSLAFPQAVGGQGFPVTMNIASQELFTAANLNYMFTPGLTHGVLGLVLEYGTADQKALYADRLMAGTWAGTMCLTEPHAGTAVPDLKSTAKPIADKPGFFKIKGQKVFISSGDHDLTDNIVHMVLARVDGDPAGHRGISLFIVPKFKVDGSGKILGPNDVTCIGVEEKLGIQWDPLESTCRHASLSIL